jgi:hypothetical protein
VTETRETTRATEKSVESWIYTMCGFGACLPWFGATAEREREREMDTTLGGRDGHLRGRGSCQIDVRGSFGIFFVLSLAKKPKDLYLLGWQRHITGKDRVRTRYTPAQSRRGLFRTTPVQVAQTPECPFRGSQRLAPQYTLIYNRLYSAHRLY